MSPGPIERMLHADHDRLSRLLDAAVRVREVDADLYREFRAGLLRHIGMEEKILLPFARAARHGEPLAVAKQLKLDHSAIAALLVPPPTPAIVARLRAVLEAHNPLEEGEHGMYAECDALAGPEVEALVARLEAARPVALAPLNDGELVYAHIERALRRAGRA